MSCVVSTRAPISQRDLSGVNTRLESRQIEDRPSGTRGQRCYVFGYGEAMSTEVPQLPQGYPAFLAELKQRIRNARLRAALSVNRELILLYWGIGHSCAPARGRVGIKSHRPIGRRSSPSVSGNDRLDTERLE